MDSDGDLNPYAPPQSNVAVQRGSDVPQLPRPTSTKWLLALIWLVVLSLPVMVFLEHQKEGTAFFASLDVPRVVSRLSILMVITVAFHAFKRSRVTYTLGILYLVFLSYIMWQQMSESVRRMEAEWNLSSDKTEIWADIFVRLTFTILVIKLCYHFIFGLPSRRFYGLTQK